MKLDLTTKLLDPYGNELKEGDKVITLGEALARALFTPYNDEQTLSGEEKYARFKLLMKIVDKKSVEVVAEEIVQLKKVTAKLFTVVLLGRVWTILDGGKDGV